MGAADQKIREKKMGISPSSGLTLPFQSVLMGTLCTMQCWHTLVYSVLVLA